MKRIRKNLKRLSWAFGIDLQKSLAAMRGVKPFLTDYRRFKRDLVKDSAPFPLGGLEYHFTDRFEEGGVAKGQYFHQDLHVARKIYENCPSHHVDVGSRVDGFIAHLAVFRRVEVFDIRPLKSSIDNLMFRQVDMMAQLDPALHEYTDSLSCLHALEHFGLGRYGDPVCASGHLVGLQNLTAMLAPGGTLYLSVPIGVQQVRFNGHRIFSLPYCLSLFVESFTLRNFSYVDEEGRLIADIDINDADVGEQFANRSGLGIFRLVKK